MSTTLRSDLLTTDSKASPLGGLRLGLDSPLAYVRRELTQRGVSGLLRVVGRFLGVAFRYPAHRAIVRVINGPSTRAVCEAFPRLAYRYTLPYLSLHFDRDMRYDMLRTHYALVNEALSPAFVAKVLAGALCVWHKQADGHALAVHVKGPCAVTRHREGEMTLAFQLDGEVLYELSFAFVRAAALLPGQARSTHAIYVGRVQGLPGQYERIRQVTKVCGEVAPPDVLMAGLAGLARALGIQHIVGVDNHNNISHETIRRSRTSFEYAELWGRYNARFIEGGHAVMDLPFAEKPITDIAARHRKRTLLKREFKKGLADQVQAAMRPYLLQR
jgi:uncharacterized protein VirK/YbjX